MKKNITHASILFLFFLFGFNAATAFASSCSTYGNTTYCDDGTSYSTYGNTTYGSDGSSYSTYGNTTYGNNGQSWSRYGNTTYGSDGTSYSQYGNTIYGSDGSSYTTYGNTTYGSGNAYSTCPTHSSKDSLTGKCSCNYGYGVNVSKTACVYVGTTYAPSVYQETTYTPTYSATENTCPINSHTSVADSTMCQCNIGYQPNSTKDGCVIVPTKSNTEICQDNFGINVEWDGTKDSSSNLNCNCKTGYAWNLGRDACILPQTILTSPTPIAPDAPVLKAFSRTETKVLTSHPPTKKKAKTSNSKIEMKEKTAAQSNSETEKRVPWYKKIFYWSF